MSAGRTPVVVSLTPLPLSADSRTLKQVTSVHRFGFKSIVIEGRKSGFAPGTLPFEVISVEPRNSSKARSAKAPPSETETNDTGPAPAAHQIADIAQVTPAVPLQSLSELRHSNLAQFILRCIPGSRRAAYVFQAALDRAIVAHRRTTNARGRPSLGEIVNALAQVARSFLANALRLPLAFLKKEVVRAAAHPLAFAAHLRIYLDLYFFRILSVAPRADLYYLHAFYQFPAVCLLCLRYRAKMIYDAHDFYSQLEDDMGFSSYWKNWVLPFERAVERVCVWFANEVVTVNEGIATLMRERFGCEPVILRNVHDLRLDCASATTIREQIGLPPDAFLVVSIGNWKPGMAMEQMFDALAGLPKQIHLAFLGSGYPSLDEATKSRGIESRVHLIGSVLPQEVVPFIASANASVVLYFGKSINYQNALPNRFFQSIAAQLPLVYPNLKEMRRLADWYGVGIMADPQKPAEIEAAFRALIEDDHRRDEIGKNLLVASRELSWEGEEQILRRLLDRQLGRAELPFPNVQNQAAR